VTGLLPALGGGANGVVPLVAGGLSGVLAMSALIASGVVPVGGGPAVSSAFVVSACQGQGFVAIAHPGDRVLVTGRSVDGSWYRVFVPGPVGEGWIRTADVDLLAGDPVPVAGCGKVAGVIGTSSPAASPDGSAIASPTVTVASTATPSTQTTTETGGQPPASSTPGSTSPSATANAPPTFTLNPPQAVPTTIGTNPLGTGSCGRTALASRLKTSVADPDGVASVQLWVLKPGSSSYVRLSHDFSRNAAYWYATIDTAKDGIQDAGTLRYRAVAIDAKGANATSRSGSLRIVRCDTEATISGGINLPQGFLGIYTLDGSLYACRFSIPWRYLLSDADGLSGNQLSYSITHTNVTPLSGTIELVARSRLGYWTGGSAAPSPPDPYAGLNTVSWTVTTTDGYGGRTSRSQTAYVNFISCPAVPN
jgi:hypothetical protein